MTTDADLVERLRKALSDGQPVELSASEVARVRAMLSTFEALQSTGRVGKWFVALLIGASGSIAAAIYVLEKLRAWMIGG